MKRNCRKCGSGYWDDGEYLCPPCDISLSVNHYGAQARRGVTALRERKQAEAAARVPSEEQKLQPTR